ncbi:MAG TPA: UDP-N-acetylglucosamine 2-epimerase (non-hydrolyzing) [Gemmatimonadales bacterium]|nr:UDP-N-acetylglucosamine 2-epimerase (non-hydrolyzing) [Gemmatimonadales bacterium]
MRAERTAHDLRLPGMMRIISVVGARPNFVKLAPVAHALAKRPGVEHLIVHTGQHYDALMSDSFFRELDIPAPSVNLEVGSASHAKQTAAVMERFEGTCVELKPDWVLVYGDVNSTVAAALVAVKLGIKVAHVEAGLRSYDRTMPEEHNRIVTDHLADLLLTPSRDAIATLKGEGIPEGRIEFVGNVMIDTLIRLRGRARGAAAKLGLPEQGFVLVTLHRPGNVDDPATLGVICDGLAGLAKDRPVVFPVHPRTRARLAETKGLGNVRLVDPVPYLEMLSLTESAALVVTDSGGVQEETTFLGVPCLTVRPNTERPITVKEGTNRLIEPGEIVEASTLALELSGSPGLRPGSGKARSAPAIERWDGRAGERIAEVLCDGKRFT